MKRLLHNTHYPLANTGKVLFVKLLHFKQNLVVFLLLFVVFPSFLLLSVSPNFPWTALWCGHCLALDQLAKEILQLRHPLLLQLLEWHNTVSRWIFLISVIISIHYPDNRHYN